MLLKKFYESSKKCDEKLIRWGLIDGRSVSKKSQNQNQAIDCKGHSMWKWKETFKAQGVSRDIDPTNFYDESDPRFTVSCSIWAFYESDSSKTIFEVFSEEPIKYFLIFFIFW